MADNIHWRQNLAVLRKEKGLTLEQMAKLTGLSKSYLSMLENGDRDFTQKSLSLIVDELKISFADLFCGCSRQKRHNDPPEYDPRKLRKIIPFK